MTPTPAQPELSPSVRLRPVEPRDLDAFFEHQRSPAARRAAAFVPPEPADDRAAFDRRWRRLLASPDVLVRSVLAPAGPDGSEFLVGHAAAFGPPEEREVTYWLDERVWGRGFGSGALAALLALEPTRPLFARVAADHAVSRRMLERAGFRPLATEPAFAAARGVSIDEVLLRLDGPTPHFASAIAIGPTNS